MELSLSRVHFPVTTLGPGRRVGIWFQGCSIRCPGCISADTWKFSPAATTVAALLDRIEPWLSECDGITVSGGEPFDQAEALVGLLRCLRERCNWDVLVFTGHPIEKIAPTLAQLPGLVDALISDPFEIHTAQTKVLRGSDNQRLHLLTPLGVQRFAEYERLWSEQDRRLDVMFDQDGSAWLAGIPARGDLQRLLELLTLEGARASTTAAPATLLPRQPT